MKSTPALPAESSVAPANLPQYPIAETMVQRINNDFVYHSPKDGQNDRYVHLRDQARGLAFAIAALTPAGREQSTALTHLETAIFYANAAIARGE